MVIARHFRSGIDHPDEGNVLMAKDVPILPVPLHAKNQTS
jgi:hypothetical protein